MNPLAAFQVLVLAMAAAIAVEALKPTYAREWRIFFLAVFATLAVLGLATTQIAAAWPAASSFMVWVGSSPVVLFLAFVTWIVVLQKPWRRSRPFDETAFDARIEAAIVRHIGEGLQRETVAETFKASDGRFGPIVEHFEGVTKRLSEGGAATEKLAKVNEAGLAAALVVLKDLRAELDDMAGELRRGAAQALNEQREFQEKMEAWVGQLQQKIRLGLRGVDQGFSALLDRERLLEMAFDIQNVGDELAGPSTGKPPGDWQAWQAKFAAWNRAVDEWARLADKHRDGVVKRVFETPRSEYKNKWGVENYDIFPDHDAAYEYKTFCIISRNFHVERKSVEYVLVLAAFRSPSRKCRGDPESEEDPMLTIPPPPEDYRD